MVSVPTISANGGVQKLEYMLFHGRYNYCVYFFEETILDKIFIEGNEAYRRMKQWLDDNCEGRFGIGECYVLFEKHEDALMCRLAF